MTPPEQSYCLIPLTQGQFALVDTKDYAWLSQWKWHARWNPGMKSFYASRKIKVLGKTSTIQMHREILGLKAGDPLKADHRKSGRTLDNRRNNLRVCTCSQNSMNQRMRRDNKSGISGVRIFKRTGRWVAYITTNGKQKHLGYFSSLNGAVIARKIAEKKLFGEFSPHY